MAAPDTPTLSIPGVGPGLAWWCRKQNAKVNKGARKKKAGGRKKAIDLPALRGLTTFSEAEYAEFLAGKRAIPFAQLVSLAKAVSLSPSDLVGVSRQYAEKKLNVALPTLDAVVKAAKPKNTPKVPRSQAAANAVARYQRSLALKAPTGS